MMTAITPSDELLDDSPPPKTINPPLCGNCRFAQRPPDNLSIAICKKLPPTPVVIMMPSKALGKAYEIQIKSMWPTVGVMDSCCSHEHREP